MGIEDVEKYELIYDFLKLDSRECPVDMKKRRRLTAAGLAVLAGATLLCIRRSYDLLIAAGLMLSALIFKADDEADTEGIESSKALIESDGLDVVYDDLIETKRIEDTSIYVGKRYLFLRERWAVRLGDIDEIVMHTVETRSIKLYFAEIAVNDGYGRKELMKLPANEKERKRIFTNIRSSIRDARAKLGMSEPEMKFMRN